jgi:branched-chain amino acid transport system ATP-binding protein
VPSSTPEHDDRPKPVLLVGGVSQRFGGLLALVDVELRAYAGEITGLIGPNGAGKTTLFNIVTGFDRPLHGRVFIEGEDVAGISPYRRARLGMARTFQRLEIFGSLSVRDNIMAAAEFRMTWARDGSDRKAVTQEIIERVGLSDVADQRVDALPTGQARLVELGRALATKPKLLLLDEPGSGLNQDETDELGRLLQELAGSGMAIVLVEHDMELVMKVCNRIYVLDFGKMIAEGTPREVRADPAVQAAYLGEEVA